MHIHTYNRLFTRSGGLESNDLTSQGLKLSMLGLGTRIFKIVCHLSWMCNRFCVVHPKLGTHQYATNRSGEATS